MKKCYKIKNITLSLIYQTNEKYMSIATEILKQLGGNRFLAMTGSKSLVDLGNGLRMNLTRNTSGANRFEILLTSMDTYVVKFYKMTTSKTFDVTVKAVKEFEGVYCDQLRDIFESVTGLRTSL